MKLIDGLNYRQWQKRNTQKFNALTLSQQKETRQQGYKNQGWQNVQNSWKIIQSLSSNLVSMFEAKLNKGDLVGALELSILEGEESQTIARKAIDEISQTQKKIDEKADGILAKYPLL